MRRDRQPLTDQFRRGPSVYLLYLFLRNGMADYMFFRAAFAFLDYDKAGTLVFLENILMLMFWAFTGAQAAALCRKNVRKAEDPK